MNVRAVNSKDVATWAAMRVRLWPEFSAGDLAREARAYIEDASGTLIAAAFIAEDDDRQPLGFLEIGVRAFSDGCDSMPIPHVEGWYVEPFARRCGVGRRLLNAAEEWARTKQFTELASDTEIHNEMSLRAHLSTGFEEVERLIKFRKHLT
jgi:aminoglycoside 6'-N-acetyltransferase I